MHRCSGYALRNIKLPIREGSIVAVEVGMDVTERILALDQKLGRLMFINSFLFFCFLFKERLAVLFAYFHSNDS